MSDSRVGCQGCPVQHTSDTGVIYYCVRPVGHTGPDWFAMPVDGSSHVDNMVRDIRRASYTILLGTIVAGPQYDSLSTMIGDMISTLPLSDQQTMLAALYAQLLAYCEGKTSEMDKTLGRPATAEDRMRLFNAIVWTVYHEAMAFTKQVQQTQMEARAERGLTTNVEYTLRNMPTKGVQ